MKVYTIESVSEEKLNNGNLRDVKDTFLENVLTSEEDVKKWCAEHSQELLPNYYWNVVEWDLEDGGFSEYKLDRDCEHYTIPASSYQEVDVGDEEEEYNYLVGRPYGKTMAIMGPEFSYAFTHIWSGLKIIGRKVGEEAKIFLKPLVK